MTLAPVICLPKGFGEDQKAPLPVGGVIVFAAQIVNNGAAVRGADLVISLPAALQLTGEFRPTRFELWWYSDSGGEGRPLACKAANSAGSVTCAVGPLESGANVMIGIGLTTSDAAVIGTSAPFTVALHPDAGDTFAATEVTATVVIAASAKLDLTLTPDQAEVTVGDTAVLIATLHNSGPSRASGSFVVGIDFGDDSGQTHFAITNSQPVPKMLATRAGLAVAVVDLSTAPTDPSFGYWSLGTLDVGKSVSVNIVVKALSVGADQLGVGAGSDVLDASCDEGSSDGGSASDSAGGPVPAGKGIKPFPAGKGVKPAAADPTACNDFAVADLQAVAPRSTPAPVTKTSTATVATTAIVTVATTVSVPVPATSAPNVSTAAGDELANTGTQQTRPMLLGAIGALLAGSLFCLLGRRRFRTGHGTHR